MEHFYFAGGVYATSVKELEPYLAAKTHPSAIHTDEDILRSASFAAVFEAFLKAMKEDDFELFSFFSKNEEAYEKKLLTLNLLLLQKGRKEIVLEHPELRRYLSDEGLHYEKLLRALFHYWLSLARFATLDDEGAEALGALKPRMLFLRKSLFHIYYTLWSHALEKKITFETDYSAGFLAGFTTRKIRIPYPQGYEALTDIPFISAADLNLPYSARTKRNKRIGVYGPLRENPLQGLSLPASDWLCLPLKCGSSLVYFYFSYKYANTTLGLLNLFEKADISECTRKPDLLVVFGGKKGPSTGAYYDDAANGLKVGYVDDTDEADYFGYVKKLILTLHNLRMIEQKKLPIHGSMVRVVLKGGKSAHIVIMGDSGAGKSESIEAFRHLAGEYLESLTILFDDMGTLLFERGKVCATGTEIGAFVRLDDLDINYAFNHLNDAIMYNLGDNNARLVYACAPYEEVKEAHPVDLFLYANNYEAKEETLRFYDDEKAFAQVCEEGQRKAKGTTGENGLVRSYFANPFGPVQKEEETHALVEGYFAAMKKQGTALGVIYTKLAIAGEEKEGPLQAAQKLLEWMKKGQNHD
jgi:hypothetical protein